MHNDPAGGVVRGAKTKMSVHMKNDKKETHDARKLKRFSSIIHTCASSTTSPTTPSAPSSSSASTASTPR